MNKKGIFQFFLLVVFFLLISYAAFTFTGGNFIPLKKSIGERQANLIKAYQNGENLLFYIDQAAKYSSFIAINDLAKNGGFYNSNCKEGDYYIYSIKCNPLESLDKNFIALFDKNFKDFIKNYPVNLSNYYSYSLDKENSIVGTANKAINLEVDKETSYSLKADFKYKLDYNFNDYSLVYNEIKDNLDCLKTNNDCFGNKFEFQWNVGRIDNLVRFNVVTKQNIFDINDKFVKKPVVIRFIVNPDKFNEK